MGGQGVDGLKGRWPGGRLPLPTAPYPLSPARVEDAPWRQVMCGWPRIKQFGKVAWPRNHRELFQSRRNALKLAWPEGRKWEESPAPVALRNEELLCEFTNLISCSGRLEHLSPEMSLKNKTKITFHLRTLLKEINNAGLHVGSPWSMKRNHITTFSNLRPMIIADLILGPTWSLKRNQILTSGNLPQKN